MSLNPRQKPYKAVPPEETCERILGLLQAIELKVKIAPRNFMGIHSCSLTLDGALQGMTLQTDGKGMAAAYAKASALGECMERIENGIWLRDSLAAVEAVAPSEFRRAPDECWKPQSAVLSSLGQPLKALVGAEDVEEVSDRMQSFAGESPLLCVPFTEIGTNRRIELPIEFVERYTTSNGMCAGNTAEEAILQGLCEIFERYAADRIQWRRLTPPDIPRSCFEGSDVLSRLEQVERKGRFTAVIKDCSLGQGLPVVGLLLLSPEEGRYRFKLGADPSPEVALERCLTESGQGGEEGFYGSRAVIDLERRRDASAEDAERRQAIDHYLNWRSGAGSWPAELFFAQPSWVFEGFHHESVSDEGDLRYLLRVLQQNGAQLWLRDNSFLGFPAFHLIVPQMSLLDRISAGRAELVDRVWRMRPTIWQLAEAPREALERLAEALEALHRDIAPRLSFALDRSFFPWRRPDAQKIAAPCEMDLLCALHRHLHDRAGLKRDLDRLLQEPQYQIRAPEVAVRAERNLIILEQSGLSPERAHSVIERLYGPACPRADATNRSPLESFPTLRREGDFIPELQRLRHALHSAQKAFCPAPLPNVLREAHF